MGPTSAFRIVRWETKILYVVLAWIAGFVIGELLRSGDASSVLIDVVASLVTLATFAVAVRIFRGRGEPVEPPRAWWRMTAWPTLSRRLGILFAGIAALSLLGLVLVLVGVMDSPSGLGAWIGSLLTYAVLAFLYLNSAARMKRLGIVRPEHFAQKVKLG